MLGIFFRSVWIGIGVLAVSVGVPVFGVTIPNGAYIVDEAEIFDEVGEEQITTALQSIEATFGVQGVVVSVGSLEGGSIQEQATNLGNFLDTKRQLDDNIFERGDTEGVGAEGTNLGFIFLIAPREQEWFLSVGLGMEKYITDGEIAVAGSRILPGSFGQGEYAIGTVAMIERVQSEVQGGGATLPELVDGLPQGVPSDVLFFLVILAFAVGPTVGDRLKNHIERVKYAGAGGGLVGLISALFVGRGGLATGGVFMIIFYIALNMKPGAGGTGPGRSSGGFSGGFRGGGGRSFGGGSFMGGGGGGKR